MQEEQAEHHKKDTAAPGMGHYANTSNAQFQLISILVWGIVKGEYVG